MRVISTSTKGRDNIFCGVEEADGLWQELDGRDVLFGLKWLFGKVVRAKKWERMVQELRLKVWVYNMLLGLGVTSTSGAEKVKIHMRHNGLIDHYAKAYPVYK